MSSLDSARAPPLVWVTVGKTQHAAFLLDVCSEKGNLVRWVTTSQKEWIDSDDIILELSPRRRRQRQSLEPPVSPKSPSSGKRRREEIQTQSERKALTNSMTEATKPAAAVPPGISDDRNVNMDDKNEIEVLYTIQPPTHKRQRSAEKKSVRPKSPPVVSTSSSSLDDGIQSSSSSSTNDASEPVRLDASRGNLSEREATASFVLNERSSLQVATVTNPATPTVEYTLTSSAYVQNLAELCFTITQDRRWRVGTSLEPLFQWESGSDLSAVTLLSRSFQPNRQPKKADFQCQCLLCRDKKQVVAQEVGKSDKAAPLDEPSSTTLEEQEEERCLYLYCRLFYRKGPWFRLDDLYSKYYAPKEKAVLNQQLSGQQKTEASSMEPSNASKENFFQPHVASANQAKNITSKSVIDQALLNQHIQRLSQLIRDLARLQNTGLTRTFNGEEEGGKTIGVALLTAEERTSVLSKLGGGKKARDQRQNGTRARARRSVASKENEIWLQMSLQQSISFAKNSTGDDTKKRVLPVLKHVDEVLLQKLSRSIIQACCRAECVPAPVMRSFVPVVMEAFRAAINKLPLDTPKLGTCIRMREAPLLTLQRCARLYLCAASGPGEMRSNGTNGWRSLLDVQAKPPLARMIPPPGLQTWNQVTYPGLLYRFGVNSACFIDAYNGLPVPVEEKATGAMVSDCIFPSRVYFKAWECCVELRAHVDYLIELNEMLRYDERRRARGASTIGNGEKPGTGDAESVDFLALLTTLGQKKLLGGMLVACCEDSSLQAECMLKEIDCDLKDLDALEGECEKILGVIAVLIMHLLRFRNETMTAEELISMSDRPWLRHLWFEGCLAYIMWDIIPIVERKGLHLLAVQSLETLLYGSKVELLGENALPLLPAENPREMKLSSLLLSRRARGKAYDRLIIDCTHIIRKEKKDSSDAAAKQKQTDNPQAKVSQFCKTVLERVVQSSSIGFSAIRGIARRLKRPLGDTLRDLPSLEAKELGLRLGDPALDQKAEKVPSCYSDWTPPTDRAVANAIRSDETIPGGRCAFLGFEDDGVNSGSNESLNVEQLALEFYNSGRLPISDDSNVLLGGWVGWHDEGGHIRALFRILCSAPVLGMDWGCAYDAMHGGAKHKDRATVHLSPYQGAPFDLHVGFELKRSSTDDETSNTMASSNGFYFRRRETIKAFLTQLARLNGQDLCDMVYDSIASRLEYMVTHGRKDPAIERDLQQLRTLSFMAAGCGGVLLAAVFRCFLFDYRHYSGGLPDLTLVRAVFEDTLSVPKGLVALEEWIGEGFDAQKTEEQAAQRGAAMLEDRDDEFLGCSKVGDSGGQNRFNRSRSSQSLTAPRKTKALSMNDLPDKLELVHDGRKVKVECMMVEVKSSNDRLDARQEDWLNVLEKNGNARVCQFEDNSKSKKKKKPAPKVNDSEKKQATSTTD